VTCFFPQTWPPGKVTNGGLSWSGPENLQPQVTENGFIIDGAYDILADLHSRLVRLDCRIGVVESCTGGLLGSLLTSLAGSSAYFQGGWLTYSKEAKIQLAGVSPETLELYGAVSLETAEEMAQGGRGRLNLSHCLSPLRELPVPGGAALRSLWGWSVSPWPSGRGAGQKSWLRPRCTFLETVLRSG
jgi:hypothetical protein